MKNFILKLKHQLKSIIAYVKKKPLEFLLCFLIFFCVILLIFLYEQYNDNQILKINKDLLDENQKIINLVQIQQEKGSTNLETQNQQFILDLLASLVTGIGVCCLTCTIYAIIMHFGYTVDVATIHKLAGYIKESRVINFVEQFDDNENILEQILYKIAMEKLQNGQLNPIPSNEIASNNFVSNIIDTITGNITIFIQ